MQTLRRLTVPILALILLAGCGALRGSSLRHVATVGAATAHSTLSAVQDAADLVECGKPTAPPQCLTTEVRNTVIAPKLSQAFALDAQAARTIRATPEGMPTPAEVGVLYAEITQLVRDVVALIPRSTVADAALAKGGVK